MVFARASAWWGVLLPRTGYDYAGAVGSGLGSSIVMAPLFWIGRNFPEAPLRVLEQGRDGTWEAVAGHEMVKLTEQPNPFYSGPLLWMATVMDYNLSGNAYWLILRNARTLAPAQLWWIPSTMIAPKWPESGLEYVSHYEYKPGLDIIKVEPSDVVHFRFGIDSANMRLGMSPLASLFREIFTDEEAANFTAALLKNMGVPGVLIAPKGDSTINEDAAEAAKAKFTHRFGGDNRGEPMVMSGAVDVSVLSFSPQQMSLKELRRIPEERVTAVMGIPAIVAGLGAGLDRATYDNVSAAREMAYENNIIPTQRLMAAELATQLLPEFEPNPERFQVGFDLSQVRVLQEDETKKAERMARLFDAGIATRADGRRQFGLDVTEADEVFKVPLAAMLVPRDELPALEAASWGPLEAKAQGTALQRRMVRLFGRQAQRHTARFEKALGAAFGKLGDRAAAAFRAAGKSNGKQLIPEDEALVARIIAGMGIDEFLAGVLGPEYQQHYLAVAQTTFDGVGAVLGVGVNLDDPIARQIIAAGGKQLGLLDLSEDSRNGLFRALEEGRAAGMGPDALASLIKDSVAAGRYADALTRAKVIARTETLNAQRLSSIEAYQHSNVVSGLLAFDNQTGFGDDDCVARDGREYTFEEAMGETAAEHPNGTLNWSPVVAQTVT